MSQLNNHRPSCRIKFHVVRGQSQFVRRRESELHRNMLWLQLAALLFAFGGVTVLGQTATASDSATTWQKPGCHKVGHTRKIAIPDCVEFSITTNACRGFCESYAVPSSPLLVNQRHKVAQEITSIGQCCNIMDAEDVNVRVLCLDGMRQITFKSATNCSCYQCKKN